MSHDLAGMLERQQLNVITSYLDASTVYGSNMNVQNKLRAFDGFGRLKVETRFTDNGMHYMPGNPKQPCVQSEERKVSGRSVNCFFTGDHRASEHLKMSFKKMISVSGFESMYSCTIRHLATKFSKVSTLKLIFIVVRNSHNVATRAQ